MSMTKEQVLLEYARCMKSSPYALKTYLTTYDNTKSQYVPLELFPDQVNYIEDLENYEENIGLKYRQAGVSTVTAAWISKKLAFAQKSKPEKVLIIANKLDTSQEFANKIRAFVEQWPSWTGIDFSNEKNSQRHYKLNNGCEVKAVATSKDALRGYTPTILIFDEAAFIEADNDFWAACMASLSTGGKVIVISCVTRDTYIFTSNGLEQVSDYIDDDVPIGEGYITKPYEILGKDKVRKSNLFLNNGLQKTKKITSVHSSLEGTHTHKLWAYSSEKNKYDWYQLSELKVGDYINVGYGMNLWGNNDSIDFKYEPNNKEKNIFTPKELTNDICYFLGLFIAEGSIYEKFNEKGELVGSTITLTCGDDLSQLLNKLNLNYYNGDGIHYNISSKSLHSFLKYLGFNFDLKAKDKIIPKRLLSLSKEKIKYILQGIFDGDGFSDSKRPRVGIGLSSIELIKQIRMLLLNFGILTDYNVINTKPTKKVNVYSLNYRITTNNKYTQVFYDEIGFNFERKQIKRIQKDIKKNSYDIIPNGSEILLEIIKNENIKRNQIKKEYHLCWGQLKRVKNLSVISFGELYNEISQITNGKYDNYIKEKILIDKSKWDKIKTIEDSENYTYDFSLFDDDDDFWCHSIYYNGYLGHQTPNGQDPIYYEIYNQALKKMNNFKISELYWWKDPRYTKDLKLIKVNDIITYLLNREDYKDIEIIEYSNIPFEERDFDEIKKQIGSGFKPISDWFEKMVKKLKYDRRKVSQELECNFLGSGDNVFDSNLMENIRNNMLREPSGKMMSGSFWIWKEPIMGHRYIMGVDVSRGDSEDFTTMQIIDFDEREQAAEYIGKIPPDVAAEIAFKWGTMYNAFIVVDITGGMGVSTSRKLQELGYRELYVDGVDYSNKWKYDPKQHEKIPGINFNAKRVQIIAAFEEYLRHEFKVYSNRLYNEMNTFVYVNGRPDHQKGQHDDLIMAMAMAIYVGENSFNQLQKVENQTKMMLESWEVNTNTSKSINFNPMMPAGIPTNNQSSTRSDYEKYSWLFGGRR